MIPSNKKNIRLLLISAGSMLAMSDAWSACFQRNDWNTVNVAMQGGSIVVRDTDAVGTLLRTFSTSIPAADSGVPQGANGAFRVTSSDRCTGSASSEVLLGNPVSVPGVTNVFSTNIPGIGVRLIRAVVTGTGGTITQVYTRTGGTPLPINGGGGGLHPGSTFNVELYKTAQATGSGSLRAGTYSRAFIDGTPAKSYLTSTLAANVITITTPTCTVGAPADQTITLPTVKLGDFATADGFVATAGKTAGEKNFNITLNCKRGVGIVNRIGLGFTGTHDPHTLPTQGVLKQSRTDDLAARHVGIQILSNQNNVKTPVVIGGNLAIGESETRQFVIPFIARYFQTENKRIVPGGISANVSFLIQYN